MLLVCALSLLVCLASASEPLSQTARSHALSLLASQRLSAAGGWDSAEATFDALTTYEQLATPTPDLTTLCPTLQTSLNAAVTAGDLSGVFYAVGSASLARCTGLSAPSGLKKVLQAGLSSSEVAPLYFSTTTALTLTSLKLTGAPKELDLSGVAASIFQLAEEDGTFRSGPEDEEGSAYDAGLALLTLARLSNKLGALVDKASLKQVVERVSALVESGVDSSSKVVDFTQGAPDNVSPLEVLALVLDGIRAVATVAGTSPIEIQSTHLALIGEYVVKHSYVSCAEDAAALSSALLFLADNAAYVPLFVTVRSSSASQVKLGVSNIVGAASKAKVSVTVESARLVGGDATLKGLVFQASASDNTEFVLTDAAQQVVKRAQPGFYDVALRLSVGGSVAQTVSIRVKVAHVATKSERVEIAFSETPNKYAAKEAHSLRYGEAIKDASLSVDASKNLHVKLSFAAGEYTPKTTFLRLQRLGGVENSALFLLKQSSDDSQVFTFKASLGSSEVTEALSGSGEYEMALVYGDAVVDRLTQWSLGKVSITLPSSSRVDLSSAASTAKPEFLHQFRQADARPFALVPLVFTLLVLAPFAGLVLLLLSSGLSFSLPTNPTEFLYAAVFQASILAILLSFTLYWLSLNIFQALALSAVCGIVAVFSGTGALRLLHQRAKGRAKAE